MRVRDPEGKQRQLLDAALAEFAERGLAGARIDAVAERAQCSAGLVYTYFGSKDGLFEAVLNDITARVVDEVPITPDDLPGYAARLYDSTMANPHVERFVAWYQLEHQGGGQPGAITQATAEKIAAVAEAQRAGVIPDRVDAAVLVLAVQSIARMWFTQPAESLAVADPSADPAVRREAVRTAVAALLRD